MRLLVTIPHFCRRDPAQPGFYGSELHPLRARVDAVSRCLASLHQTFGPKQVLTGGDGIPANTDLRTHLEVILITSGDQHLVDELPRHLFFHQATTLDPRALGFVAHHFLRMNLMRFDWFAFLEDDIGVTDALLFDKLAWFNAQFGASALLQPNRFELSAGPDTQKLYVDGNTARPELTAQFQDVSVRRYLRAAAFGRPVRFQRVDNPHSGCFFVNAQQLERLITSPRFAVANTEFFGPLESAATLPVMNRFEVYKPSRENAAFLEVEHLGRRHLADADSAPPASTPEAAPADGAPVSTPVSAQ